MPLLCEYDTVLPKYTTQSIFSFAKVRRVSASSGKSNAWKWLFQQKRIWVLTETNLTGPLVFQFSELLGGCKLPYLATLQQWTIASSPTLTKYELSDAIAMDLTVW